MNVILVIITWMLHVPLITVEMPQPSMQKCQELKIRYEQAFTQTEGLGFIIECKEQENDAG